MGSVLRYWLSRFRSCRITSVNALSLARFDFVHSTYNGSQSFASLRITDVLSQAPAFSRLPSSNVALLIQRTCVLLTVRSSVSDARYENPIEQSKNNFASTNART